MAREIMLEKEIENQIFDFLRTIGVYCWKNQSVGIFDPTKKVFRKPKGKNHLNGTSDILGIIQGRMLAIEVKSEKGVLRPEQRIFITRVNDEGGIAFVTRSLENCIENLLKFFPNNPQLRQFSKEYVASNGMDH